MMWVIVQQFENEHPAVYGPFESEAAALSWATDRNDVGGFSNYDPFSVVEVRKP